MIAKKIKKLFDVMVDITFSAILLILILGIAIGTLQLFTNIFELLQWKGVTGQYLGIITDVLTLFVLVELSRSLVDYFITHHLRLTFIVDAAIVFILRELMIGLFKHEIEPALIYSLSVLLLVLGLLRIGSILLFQRERQFVAMLKTTQSSEPPQMSQT